MWGFPRVCRLVSKQDFQSVFANNCKISNKYLLVLYRPNSFSHARLGIVLSKRFLKQAIDRNMFRRVVRDSFRLQQDSLKGLDIVVLLRSECTPLSGHNRDKKTLREDVDQLWQLLAKFSKIY